MSVIRTFYIIHLFFGFVNTPVTNSTKHVTNKARTWNENPFVPCLRFCLGNSVQLTLFIPSAFSDTSSLLFRRLSFLPRNSFPIYRTEQKAAAVSLERREADYPQVFVYLRAVIDYFKSLAIQHGMLVAAQPF